MAATSFLRFLELPKDLQMQIWEEAIETLAAEGYETYGPLGGFNYFRITPRYARLDKQYIADNSAHKLVGPGTGKTIYWSPCWYDGFGEYGTDWIKLLNACSLSRMLALKWMKKEAEEWLKLPGFKWPESQEEHNCFIDVAGEIIDDLDARLRQ